MLELSKLESLVFDLDKTDAFEDCYIKMLAEAAVAQDKKKMRAMREILLKQMAFLAIEMVKAKREECGTGEIVQ